MKRKCLEGGYKKRHVAMAATVFAAMMILSAQAAEAEFTCDVKSSCTGDEIEVFSMWSTSNAHAEIASLSNYNYRVCCGGMGNGMLSGDCPDVSDKADIVLKLSSSTNAHVSSALSGSTFPVDVCLSTLIGKVKCTVRPSCASDEQCLASISSMTNAHVGTCTAYSNRVCCIANEAPEVTEITYPTGDTRGPITFTAEVNDDDGDVIQDVNFSIIYDGGQVRNFPLETSAPWQVTWDSFEDTGSVIDPNVIVRAMAYDGAEWSPWFELPLTVDNTQPHAWFTNPPNETRAGRVFNVTWEGNGYATGYDFQYVEDPGSFFREEDWEPAVYTEDNYYEMDPGPAHNSYYCFRIRARDDLSLVPGEWSCSPIEGQQPQNEGCTCVWMDTEQPESQITSSPQYNNMFTFEVNWSGDDTDGVDVGSGISCYQIEFNMTDDKKHTTITGWNDWYDIYNEQRLVYDGGECRMAQCTTLKDGVFDQTIVSNVPSSEAGTDAHTFYFGVRAIDDAYGCANIENLLSYQETGTWIDTHGPPDMTVQVRDADGLIGSPNGKLYLPDAATFSISADPSDLDYTGITRTGLIYKVLKQGAGYFVEGEPEGIAVDCESGQSSCEIEIREWNSDYNITYKSFALDMAGNRNESIEKSFLVLKPLKIATGASDIYMTLGSSKAVSLAVSNRQSDYDKISIKLMDYPHAKFIDITEGEMGYNNRSVNITLSPKETKTVHILVYTSETGDDYNLYIQANTTRVGMETKIEDSASIEVRVVYPQEFPGLGLPAVMALIVIASLLYFRFSKE